MSYIAHGNEKDALVAQAEYIQNSTMRYDAHVKYDERVLRIQKEIFVGVSDLNDRGLYFTLPNMGTSLSYYERVGDMTKGRIAMDAGVSAQKDRLTYDRVGVPIPFFSKDFSLTIRQLENSRDSGADSTLSSNIEEASSVVARDIEDALFNGVPDLISDGYQIYGYTNHPNRSTVTLAGSGWATASGRNIIGDVKRMRGLLADNNYYNNYMLYIAQNMYMDMADDFSTVKGNLTNQQRIMAMGIQDVKVSPVLADNNCVLVALQSNVVDMAIAKNLTVDLWSTMDKSEEIYRAYAVLAPRVKSDKNGNCGVVHGSV